MVGAGGKAGKLRGEVNELLYGGRVEKILRIVSVRTIRFGATTSDERKATSEQTVTSLEGAKWEVKRALRGRGVVHVTTGPGLGQN